MRLAGLVAAVHDSFDSGQAMADVEAICSHDRYQASAGIADAAAYVAERAQAAGLARVQVLSFPADGREHWWTYRAPTSWTPLRASVTVDGVELISYPEQPYRLAAYSAATAARQLPVVRFSAVRRGEACARQALVVGDEPVAFGALAGLVAAQGGLALAVDPLAAAAHRQPGQLGRLELPAGTPLAAFSIEPGELATLIAAADAGSRADVDVELSGTDYPMPVVTGVLPGSGDHELLLSAHLCHPRPSANDNASGVAALLGAARVLAQAQASGGRGVRFLWGPEFVGLAAYLHDFVTAGRAPAPAYVVNVDMAGEDVSSCGGPLVIERGPDDVPSVLPALAQRCAELLPPASRSYSGAVPCEPWHWRATPFAGGSDHALAADWPVRSQAITLGHWPDRANHSSADIPELVDPAELRRTAVIAGTLAAALGKDHDDELAADLRTVVTSWAADHVLSALPGRAPTRTSATGQEPSLDPWAPENAARLLRHRGEVAVAALGPLAALGADRDWLDSTRTWVQGLVTAAMTRSPQPQSQSQPPLPPAEASGPPLARSWDGPANVRAVSESATAFDREWLGARLAEDRGGNYARALAMMRGVDGERDGEQVAWWAALSTELALPVSFARSFTDLLCRAGFTSGGWQS